MAASTAATAHETARSRMRSASTSRRSASSCLLSLRPRMGRSGDNITAPANTAPNSDPRPTSSTPATATKPRARSSRSSVPSQRSFATGFADATCAATRGLLAFAEPRRLTLQVAQIIQLRAPYPAGSHHVDVIDHPRMQRKNALHTLSEAHLPDRDALPHSRIFPGDHGAFERLQPFFVAFLDLDVYANCVSRPELRDFRPPVFLDELGQ